MTGAAEGGRREIMGVEMGLHSPFFVMYFGVAHAEASECSGSLGKSCRRPPAS